MTRSPASSSSSAPLLSRSPSRSPSPHLHGFEHKLHLDIDNEGGDDLEALSIRHNPPPFLEKPSRHSRHSSSSSFQAISRRPLVSFTAAILATLILLGVFAVVRLSTGEDYLRRVPPETDISNNTAAHQPQYPPQVLGAPTQRFRDNLRDDTRYITSWIAAGWTNDFMTYVNLLYLALLTNRTAVIPPFAPSHVGSAAGFVPVGEVFDLPRLAADIGVPIIEWSDIKNPDSGEVDELGCWSIWATAAPEGTERKPRFNIIEPLLGLDISYTPIPASAIMYPQYNNDPHTRFFSLAALTYPDGRQRAHLEPAARFPSPQSGHTTLPDEQMACFDFPYYVSSEATFEFKYDWSPAWRFVGTHAHWTPRLEGLALHMIRQTFGTDVDEATPSFISMHVRHGDFGRYCQDDESDSGCFAPLSAFARRVDEVRVEIKERLGMEVERVLVTSDERDPAWWAAVREMGWDWIDHAELKTEERFGKWYPVLIDAVVQSLGAGFVGTDRSTMSLIAQRRVEDWNGGATREVKWGEQGADAHKRALLDEDFVF